MAETERENIRESTLEGLDTAARKGKHGGRPPVITDDMLHAVLRRRAGFESVEQIQPDLIIPTGKRKGQRPSVTGVHRALAEHEKARTYPEAIEAAHADFVVLQNAADVPHPRPARTLTPAAETPEALARPVRHRVHRARGHVGHGARVRGPPPARPGNEPARHRQADPHHHRREEGPPPSCGYSANTTSKPPRRRARGHPATLRLVSELGHRGLGGSSGAIDRDRLRAQCEGGEAQTKPTGSRPP